VQEGDQRCRSRATRSKRVLICEAQHRQRTGEGWIQKIAHLTLACSVAAVVATTRRIR